MSQANRQLEIRVVEQAERIYACLSQNDRKGVRAEWPTRSDEAGLGDQTLTTEKNIAAILTDLGFEVADSPGFVADVARLAGSWNRNGLIFRIRSGAMTYGEAAETADAILEAISPDPADLSKAQERYMEALAARKADLIARGDERRHHEAEGLEALFVACFDGVAPHDAMGVFLEALDSTKAEARGDAQQHRDLEAAEALFREIFGIAAR